MTNIILKGSYKYNEPWIQKAVGYDHTNFEINILVQNSDGTFSGSITDDQKTGGTPGVGDVHGKMEGSTIKFVKQMPVMTLVSSSSKIQSFLENKHPKIYYTGTFSEDKKSITGTWKNKWSIQFKGLRPIFCRATSGTWNAHIKNHS